VQLDGEILRGRSCFLYHAVPWWWEADPARRPDLVRPDPPFLMRPDPPFLMKLTNAKFFLQMKLTNYHLLLDRC
jgi:hypothetical protein